MKIGTSQNVCMIFNSKMDMEEAMLRPIAFGGDGGGVPHVPIPNTTVKPSSADGTWTAGSWESRTPPSELFHLT